MQLIRAEQKYSRQSPRKVRLVVNAVKKLPLSEAVAQLAVIDKKATHVVLQLMRQAIANATNNLGLSVSDLELHEIIVNKGTSYKRMRAVSRGRGHGIEKKTCHVRVVLRAKDSEIVKKPVKKEVEKKEVKTENKSVVAEKSSVITKGETIRPKDVNKMIDKSKMVDKVQKPMAARLQPKKTVNRTTSK